MSFEKVIPSKISEYKIFDVGSTDELIKVANEIDFPEGFVYDSDFLYMWVRIVSSGEAYGPNKNGDYFPEEELISYWETFHEANPFKDHKNKSVEDSIGKIITVRWNPVMKCVEILKGVDKKRAPEIARGYLKGYLTDVSMGCKVPYTVCSICGNKARKRSEFCDHVRFNRLQFLGNGERVYEINYKPKFHDSSTVLNGAERVAKAFFIFEKQPDNAIVPAFRKAASSDGIMHFVSTNEEVLEKVASIQSSIHPLLKEDQVEKLASESPMMRKIAELEKELTGKLLNVMSAPKKKRLPVMKQMLEIIKFLSEKRMDESTLKRIALSVKEVAKENGVPTSKAFATLIGVAELMGIELFPNELHTILRNITDAGLNEDLDVSDPEGEEAYPSDYSKGMSVAVKDLGGSRDLHSPSSLLELYDEVAHNTERFKEDPMDILSLLQDQDDLDFSPPQSFVKVIHRTLSPIMKLRSRAPEHLLPRLSVVLKGDSPLIGGPDVLKDLGILSSPNTAGDHLGRLAYSLYENMRPGIAGSRLFKVAEESGIGMEKSAAKYEFQERVGLAKKPKLGLSTGKLALMAVPAAYGASALQKNRRENDRFLSDGDNFIADHPGILAGGAILAGKPLSRAVHSAARKGKAATGKGIEAVKAPFTKEAEQYAFEGMVKVADSISPGAFNIFDGNEVTKRYMSATGASPEEASAVKTATLLSVGEMEKEAFEIMRHYQIPNQEKGNFLKIASEYMDEEMSKAAEDFTNNMILSAIGDTNPLARTLPGRAVDAFVFKKLGDASKPKEPKQEELSHDHVR